MKKMVLICFVLYNTPHRSEITCLFNKILNFLIQLTVVVLLSCWCTPHLLVSHSVLPHRSDRDRICETFILCKLTVLIHITFLIFNTCMDCFQIASFFKMFRFFLNRLFHWFIKILLSHTLTYKATFIAHLGYIVNYCTWTKFADSY